MKLLELTRSYYPAIGGFEKSIYDKTKIYNAFGINYKIITTDFYSKLSDQKRDSSIVYLKQFTPYNITPSLPQYLTDDYDVVNINLLGRYYSDYAIQHYSKTKTKIILAPHSFYHGNRYGSIKSFLEKWTFPYLLKKIDALIAFTEYEKAEWIYRYQIPAEKIFVIPHFVELGEHKVKERYDDLGKYFLYLGRNDINKKSDLLIESFLRLKNNEHSLAMTLTLSDVRSNLRERVQQDKRILLLGYVEEAQKQELLAHADAVVFPTTWEAFGYVAFEASIYSKPLLCSDIPVFRELLDDRGVIYFQNTIDGLSGAFSTYLTLAEKSKKRIGAVNRRNVKKYSFETSVKLYKELFKRINLL